MASLRPSSRYSSVDSTSSSSSASDPRNPNKNLSSLQRLVPSSSSRRDHIPVENTTRALALALARTASAPLASSKAKNGQNFGSMVKKFMDKRSGSKLGSAGRTALAIPADPIAEDVKKAAVAKGSGISALHRKLFQKGGGSAERTAGKALTEVKPNTRTLAMVLRSERELMSQNQQYEQEIAELRLLVEEKSREVEKLKDLCLKQREEIKALKDAILFPDVMNCQLHELLESQGSELKQAKQVIPSLQKQVSSLTGQLQCLADDLAEVKADKYAVKAFFDGHVNSPKTPIYFAEASNSLEYSSGDPITPLPGSPDDMFLKDLNPCLTPHFARANSMEYDETLYYDTFIKVPSCQNNTKMNPDMSFGSRVGMLSKSSEHCQRSSLGSTAQKIRSDEKKRSAGNVVIRNI